MGRLGAHLNVPNRHGGSVQVTDNNSVCFIQLCQNKQADNSEKLSSVVHWLDK